MPSESLAVSISHLTKTYRLFGHPGDRIKQFLTIGLRQYHREFTALKDVSIEIPHGETLGIVGRNGSGKSTLLQIVCGILKPTKGVIQTSGRISALLELGSGFNPEFTGRENVYFQGLLLGLSKTDIDDRFDAIADFAGIGEFIEQPVRVYSSGMFVRLAFAVAVNLDPEILVIDEALAVGDAEFQRKCYRRIRQIKEKGVAIIIVSHAMSEIIDICDRAILLEKGETLIAGRPKLVLDEYERLLFSSAEHSSRVAAEIAQRYRSHDQVGSDLSEPGDIQGAKLKPGDSVSMLESLAYHPRGAVISKPRIIGDEGYEVTSLARGASYAFQYEVRFDADASNVRFSMMIKSTSGYALGGLNSHSRGEGLGCVEKGSRLTIRFPFRCLLLPGRYSFNAGVIGIVDGEEVFLHRIVDAISMDVVPESGIQLGGKIDFSLSDKAVTIAPIDQNR